MLYSTIVLVACYVTGSAGAFVGSPAAGRMQQSRVLDVAGSQLQMAERNMLSLKGKVAFVAGVADSSGYGWAICKALAEVGAATTLLLQQQQVLLHHPSPGRAPELPVLPPRLSPAARDFLHRRHS